MLYIRCVVSLAAVLAVVSPASALTSFSGSTGLIYVPTADVVPNSSFAFGGVITDYQAFPGKSFSHFQGDNKPSFYFAGYLTLGFVPRVEVTIRGNGMPWSEGPAGPDGPFYTDGMFSAQILLLRGGGKMPSLAVGIQDAYGFLIFNALYGVATWRTHVWGPGLTEFTLGWASDVYDEHIGTRDADSAYEVVHVLNGLLLGVEQPLTDRYSLLAEYDSVALNVGFRLRIASWCILDLAAARWSVANLRDWRVRGFAAHLHFDGKL